MSEESDLIRARRAEGLLEDPVLKQAFSSIEGHYTEVWRNSGPSEYELREECHAQLYALAQFRRQLHSYLETGKILMAASENLNELGDTVLGRRRDYDS